MITLGYNGEWHVITILDQALLCRHNMTPEFHLGWDYSEDITDSKQVEELDESVCPKCVRAAMMHNMRDDEIPEDWKENTIYDKEAK